MIRNDAVRINSLVAVGTDDAVPVEARGRMGVVTNITWPAREGRGRRLYQAMVLFACGSAIQVPERFLSRIPLEPGLLDLVGQARAVVETASETPEETLGETGESEVGEPAEPEVTPTSEEIVVETVVASEETPEVAPEPEVEAKPKRSKPAKNKGN